ncbi:MAG: Bax inhibitor-1/YccA family protein, partial [Myxococcota bacterium]
GGAPSDVKAEQRRFMGRVCAWMSGGLALTGVVALWVASQPALVMAIATNRLLFYGLLLAELAAVFAFAPIARRASATVAAGVFLFYAALNGVTFSLIFLIYTTGSIASTFFVAGGTFAAMSVYGLVTRRDLSGMGRFMMMGLFGLIIAGVVNIFLRSDVVSWVSACVGVLVFSGLTAYHAQKIQAMNVLGNEGTDEDRKEAISGALVLYLDFINLFLSLLRLLGRRR